MWYFLIRQEDVKQEQYAVLQQKAALTEVEIFNEPYANWYVFTIVREQYRPFMEWLDLQAITYEAVTQKPTREDLLKSMR